MFENQIHIHDGTCTQEKTQLSIILFIFVKATLIFPAFSFKLRIFTYLSNLLLEQELCWMWRSTEKLLHVLSLWFTIVFLFCFTTLFLSSLHKHNDVDSVFPSFVFFIVFALSIVRSTCEMCDKHSIFSSCFYEMPEASLHSTPCIHLVIDFIYILRRKTLNYWQEL